MAPRSSMWDFTKLRRTPRSRWPFSGAQGENLVKAGVVCIASGKGGVGKSVIASNLACMRAAAGERVCLVDFDAGLANAHLLLGLTPQHDLGSILDGQVTPEGALVEGPAGVKVLSGGVGRARLANPTRRELGKLFGALRSLEESHDLLIIELEEACVRLKAVAARYFTAAPDMSCTACCAQGSSGGVGRFAAHAAIAALRGKATRLSRPPTQRSPELRMQHKTVRVPL